MDVHSDDYQNLVVNQGAIFDSVLHVEKFINDFSEYNKLYLNDFLMSKDVSYFIDKIIFWKKQGMKNNLCAE
jgi:hypothetical protein